GKGGGGFLLNDFLPIGKEGLKAWSDWLVNFGDDFIFSQHIYIGSNLDEAINQKATSTKRIAKNNPLIGNTQKGNQIQLFPEGGSMVENIPGIIAFKSSNGGFDAVITNLKNEIISEVSSPTGIGSFMMTPLNDEMYFLSGVCTN